MRTPHPSRLNRIGATPSTALTSAISVALGMCAMFTISLPAEAGDILRGGSVVGTKPGSNASGGPTSAAAAQAAMNAKDALARTTQAVQSVRAMQKSAREIARRGPNNLGMDPNHAGVRLPNVPNGLVVGGLQVAPGVPVNLSAPTAGENASLWRGALLPKSTVSKGKTTVGITQTQSQAVLTWKTFNVGKETTVNFNQARGTQKDGSNSWIAFNLVLDPSGIPSQILGSITGPGSVYLINQNGIIFGGSSQVNLHSFVASSLPINENLVSRGLLNNPDAQFLFSSLPILAGANGTPAFTPEDPLTPDGTNGDVKVQAGAVIKSPSNDAKVGGRVMLLGANVHNAGTISTPDGQTILAAGLQIGFGAHASSDPSLRGLDVFVGAVAEGVGPVYAGAATNSGLILTPRANLTMAGKNVKQLGAVDSSTSVSLNGRVDLLASFDAVPYPISASGTAKGHAPFLFKSTGTVTLGPGSATQILPEFSNAATVVGTTLALPSQVNINGLVIHLASDSTLLAPGAAMTLNAGTWKFSAATPTTPVSPFIYSAGQIYLDSGALINAAGSTGVSALLTSNILSLELRGSEFADAPLQRDGIFRGATIQIDARESGIFNGANWVGTPLANAAGYVGLIERSVGELTIAGGNVKLNAGGSVVLQSGSKVDVSGGTVEYLGGLVKTTRLIQGARLLDITQATPDQIYDGIYTGNFTEFHPKYSFSETFKNPLALDGEHFEPGYTHGGNGGSLTINAPAVALDGSLVGHTVTGPRQRVVGPGLSTLSLTFQAQSPTGPRFQTFSPTPPKVIFQNGLQAPAPVAFRLDPTGNPFALRPERRSHVFLAPELVGPGGFGNLTISNADGGIVVSKGVSLNGTVGGSLTLDGSNIDIEGSITIAGGNLTLTAHNISPTTVADLLASPDAAQTPEPNKRRGHFTLGADAKLNTAGLIVDDRAGTPVPGEQPFINGGGSVSISSYNVNLISGSTIDVSGGVALTPTGKRTYGNGGRIVINAGQAATVARDPVLAAVIGGHLNLGANLLGYSGAKGGSLSILAPRIQVGGLTRIPGTLLLPTDFFNQGGFASFTLKGLGALNGAGESLPAILISAGIELAPQVRGSVAVPDSNGTNIALIPVDKPEGYRSPVSLTFNALGVRDSFTKLPIIRGDLVLGRGTRITTDALGSVTLTGETATVLGSIFAPGGAITIGGGRDSNVVFPEIAQAQLKALATVFIGPNSVLSAKGKTVMLADPRGNDVGLALRGGSINVSGNIVAAAGSRLNVSGTQTNLDLALGYGMLGMLPARPMEGSFLGSLVTSTLVETSAGSISLAGGQALFSDATLIGRAGGPSALGGSITLSSGRFVALGDSTPQTPLSVTLFVTQDGLNVPQNFLAPGKRVGKPIIDGTGNALAQGHISISTFARGGFDAVSLMGSVDFSGLINLATAGSLNVGSGGVIFSDSAVRLTAPHVVLGTPFRPPFAPEESRNPFQSGSVPFNFSPTYGAGSLTVTADLIDIGNLSLQGIGLAKFIAHKGDIRGDGTLNVAGKIVMIAGQVYPPTAVAFAIAASDYTVGGLSQPGSVTIIGSGSRPLPLSVGGLLTIHGSIIEQRGTVRAPLGTIHLGWDGVGTPPINLITGQAVAATTQLTLGKGSYTSVSGIDPQTGQGALIPFGLNFNGISWIDPSGTDITATGAPGKAIRLSAANITDAGGSLIDIRGGGDIFAYRWVPGTGGSNDILASTTTFAVIPNYSADYAPYAPFTTASRTGNLGGDPGYVNSALRAGDKVYLGASNGLPAGMYTLLPARYALLPGAFLVTPKTGIPNGTHALPDGSSIVTGSRSGQSQTEQSLGNIFEIASGSVVRQRAQYDGFSGNIVLTEAPRKLGLAVPRAPRDAGHLVLTATQSLILKGRVAADAPQLSRGGLVDISSALDIRISGSGSGGAPGELVLKAGDLNRFGAESLLIGGLRQFGSNGITIQVKSSNVTVDNAGSPLRVPELVLVANRNLTLADGAQIDQTGLRINSSETMRLGTASVPGSGDGTLLLVSSDPSARIVRAGLGSSTLPNMMIGTGVTIAGEGVILDSTYATSLDPSASLDGKAISLNSGQISLQLNDPGALQPTVGLVLAGAALQSLQSAGTLSLLSYSSIDVYGNGTVSSLGTLALHASEIRGFNTSAGGTGTATFSAPVITLDNSPGGSIPGIVAAASGTLEFEAETIRIGSSIVKLDQFANLELTASRSIIASGTGGLAAQGSLTATTPIFAAGKGAVHTFSAGGVVTIQAPTVGSPGGASADLGGLGASLTFEGASIVASSAVSLPSGSLTLHATTGDVNVDGGLDVGGTAQLFYDLTRYTDGGSINLISDTGSVTIGGTGSLSVAAQGAGGNAGAISISAPLGAINFNGSLQGQGGVNGRGGAFSIDVATIPGGSLAALGAKLDAGGFFEARAVRLRTGDLLIDGTSAARTLRFSTDAGSITVNGILDASGVTGGSIGLYAHGSIALATGSILTAAGQDFSTAGQGGAITLEAGSQTNGIINAAAILDVQAGSTIDLSVAQKTATSAGAGQFSGTLHLRAPQTAGAVDLRMAPLNGTIVDASSIVIEGYQLLTPAGGLIAAATRASVSANGTAFTANTGAMTARLLASNAALNPVVSIVPGTELINLGGNLTLGTAASINTSDWDFSTFRFGPKNVPGILTMRASGDLVFFNSLSDGFVSSAYTALLLAQNPLLQANAQSWSYRLTAGADFSSADFHGVRPLANLTANSGSLLLGKNGGTNISNPFGTGGLTQNAIGNRFQVIRTGSGSIDISTGRDLHLLNQFATIYTAGTQILNPTTVKAAGDFDLPVLSLLGGQGSLGAVQQSPLYAAQYTYAGGNVALAAGGNIAHLTRDPLGNLIADSEREMPTNWLYRRGYVDPATGQFGVARWGDVASTTWWVDFSNFFEGVGALGGGNVSLIAGRDIANVDAMVPTNARMPKGTPRAADLVEFGGGDLTVRAGHDIDGGVYYIERGQGTLRAGNQIRTNATRSPSLTILKVPNEVESPNAWLPTTLFLGKGSFEVAAQGDLLLGPVANPFMLPGGVNNTFWYKSYFSTYAPTSSVNVSSLGGSVTLRTSATLAGESTPTPLLQAWFQRELLLVAGSVPSASFYQPWLRLNESQVAPFRTAASLMAPTFRATAFSGNLNLVGGLTLFPSARGTVDLAAANSINGLHPNGMTNSIIPNTFVRSWGSGGINLSDADPNSLPGVASPFAYQTISGVSASQSRATQDNFLSSIDVRFAETGSTQDAAAALETKQALHASGILHAGDPNPVHLYALNGDISGLTLFSAKSARVIAGNDLSDIALYIQNTSASDLSVVSAGRDIIAYAPNSPLRILAQAPGNALNSGSGTLAGDIQISGPGVLEVLAGRNLDLGIGPNNPDGTGVGILSLGNARNPALPFEGASIFAGAGIGSSLGLANSSLDIDSFLDQLTSTEIAGYLAELNLQSGQSSVRTAAKLDQLAPADRAHLALEMFYLVLRDAGRDKAITGNYDSGFAAIDALFSGTKLPGDILLTSREVKTKSGGNISLFAPGGGLTVGFDISGNQALDQGVLTESGGNISIFTHGDVNVGTSRIFTLRGGNEIIWSSTGDIAAGASSKTVQSAPPTRVIVDAQTGDVKTDLAGLATGGGIGVLATVANVTPGNVALIAPGGTVDAGDAGVRASGNVFVAAATVLNASNFTSGGTSSGVPASAPSVGAPSLGSLGAGQSAAGSASSAAGEVAKANRDGSGTKEEPPSIIVVEVLGYGAADPADSDEEEEKRKKRKPS